MKKPSPFTLLDAVTFGAAAVLMTGVATWVASTDEGLQAKLLMCVMALGFWIIYVRRIFDRQNYLKRFTITVRPYALFVDPGDFSGATLLDLAKVADEAVAELEPHLNGARETLNTPVWATFKPGPLEHPMTRQPAAVNGYTAFGGEAITVGWKPGDKVQTTAFAHELKHVIIGRCLNNWDVNLHHDLMQKYGKL